MIRFILELLFALFISSKIYTRVGENNIIGVISETIFIISFYLLVLSPIIFIIIRLLS
jgi:hypothetical protein